MHGQCVKVALASNQRRQQYGRCNEAGIENYGHFQGRVTKRTRTITGDKHAFLFTWDDWNDGENAERGYGHYAVTDTTFRSLRGYFKLD